MREPRRTLLVQHRLALVALLALAGCAGPSPQRPAADALVGGLPTMTTPAGATVQQDLAIDRWWTHFGDAHLERLIEGALVRNADLAVAAARLREARAQLDEARGAALPSLDLQATNARARASAQSLGLPAPRTGSSHEVSLVGRYDVDLWGRLAATTDAAQSRLAAQAWARASVEWGLSAQLAEAHFTLRGVQRQLEIAQAVRASRARTAAMRGNEHRAGAASEFELRRADAELAAAESTIASLQRQRLALEAALALLSGEPIERLGAAPDARVPLDPAQAFEVRLPQGDASQLLLRRPDLRQAQAQLEASHADITAARAAKLPRLSLSGDVGSDVREIGQILNGPGFAWSLAASVVQSVFDGGRSTARVAQSEARSDAALAQYRRSVAAAFSELREAYAALDVANDALTAQRRRVAALERAHRLARLGTDAGALAQLDLLDAERNLFQAQLAEVDAYRDRLIGQVAAYKALGGGHAGLVSEPFTQTSFGDIR